MNEMFDHFDVCNQLDAAEYSLDGIPSVKGPGKKDVPW